MNVREHLSVLLSFSKRERRGVYLLLSISMLVWVMPVFFTSEKIPEDILRVTPLEIEQAKHILVERYDSVKFQRKGQHAFKREHYSGHTRSTKDSFIHQIIKQGTNHAFRKTPLNINKADSVALEKLPGIGEKLSSRIIRYRDRLGGFVNLSQIGEVYGLSDSVMQLIVPLLFIDERFVPVKIDVNQAGYTELRKHPYFTHSVAKAILAYRGAHGNFKSIDDIYNIISVGGEEVKRCSPYVSFSD